MSVNTLGVKARFAFVLLGAVLGLAVGAAAMTRVLYDKTGRRLVQKIQEVAGSRVNNADRFAFGYTTDHPDEWKGVKSPKNPNWEVRRGVDLVQVAAGLDYPVNLVFVAKPGSDPDSPVFYVNELHGRIRYVGRDGELHTYGEGLLNFEPVKGEEKSDETGVSGLAPIPGSEDLLATAAYRDPASKLLWNRILRLKSAPGGKKLDKVETILELKEYTSPSNQIQQAAVGPDGKLYVSVGDAENHELSLDLGKFGGKILRMNLDGTSCEDNPFYEETAPESPRSYIYAYGIRNAFDVEFAPDGSRLYAVDNGKNLDRLFEVVRGASYGWNGDPESIRVNALYTWGPVHNTAPVGVTFLREPVLGAGTANRGYIACYGPAAGAGPNAGKSIIEFEINPKSGMLARAPEPLIRYVGPAKATVLGLAEGPDGLYFTDFWGETNGMDDAQGRIWKVVPSKETLGLPIATDEKLASLPPAERGAVHFARNCSSCHTVDGVGGREGPELTHVKSNLTRRLGSGAYDAAIAHLMTSDGTFTVKQRPRLEEVSKTKGDQRLRVWIKNHLEEPRFDNLQAKMPSFESALKPEVRNDIIEFLMTRG